MQYFKIKSLDDLIRSALLIGSVNSYWIAMLNIFVNSIPYLKVANGMADNTCGGRQKQEQLV